MMKLLADDEQQRRHPASERRRRRRPRCCCFFSTTLSIEFGWVLSLRLSDQPKWRREVLLMS